MSFLPGLVGLLFLGRILSAKSTDTVEEQQVHVWMFDIWLKSSMQVMYVSTIIMHNK